MAKKIEINENWEPVEVEDLDNLFIVIFKHGSFDQGYVEAFDTDDALMQSAYDSLAKQYNDCGCDDLTKIYLIKVPNTEQTVNMCNTGLFNGNCCDPHIIEATRDLFNRADCEHLSCWEGCGLTEAKKKKNIIPGGYLTVTTGDPALNIKHFNKCMGTDGLGNAEDHPHLVVGDTLPNGPIADTGSSEGASDTSGSTSDGGAMGESLDKDINLNSAKKEIWVQQDDGQLKSIEVDPAEKKEELTETYLDYSTQLSKMRQLEAGTRGFNAKSASLDKILFNYKICLREKLPKARKVMEDALRLHGWDQYIRPGKKQVDIFDYKLKQDDFIVGMAMIVWAKRNDAWKLIADYGSELIDMLIILIFALYMNQADLAGRIKNYILDNFTVTLDDLKAWLSSYVHDSAFSSYINNMLIKDKICEGLKESVQLDEAKRYVKRYYVRPLNIFCGNKEDIIQALIRAGDQNCSVYSLKNLTDHEDVHLLQPSDIIYYWDDRVLYDKNHVQVMDYDLFVKHEEERKKVGNVDAMSDSAFSDMYNDRATEDDLKDKEVIANYKALNKITR